MMALSIKTIIVRRRRRREWPDLRAGIENLERLAFGRAGWGPRTLARDFHRPGALAFSLEIRGALVGYALIQKSWHPRRAYLWSIAIAPSFQGQGLVGRLSRCFERELKRQGYREWALHAAEDNGYAAAVVRHYRSRVVRQYRCRGKSRFGRQRYILISLD